MDGSHEIISSVDKAVRRYGNICVISVTMSDGVTGVVDVSPCHIKWSGVIGVACVEEGCCSTVKAIDSFFTL